MLTRRELVRSLGWGAVGAAASALPLACRRPRKREDVLSEIILDVVAPDTTKTADASQALAFATGTLSKTPTRAALAAARGAFHTALTAWKRAQCFRDGPMVETDALLRASFWPARPQAIEAALTAPRADAPSFVDELGVDAKGIFAIEHLLFPLNTDPERVLASLAESGARRARFVHALADNVAGCARKAATVLGDGAAYSARFAQGGQQSVSRLVGQMVSTVEALLVHRLDLVLGLERSRMLKPAEVEGWPSGTSHTIALVELETTERLYGVEREGGLSELVRPVAPAIDDRVRERLGVALEAVRKIHAPLERTVVSDRPALSAAAEATKALELALKVDLASALGVTVTFQSGDGD
jgi:predicted lipoprotein